MRGNHGGESLAKSAGRWAHIGHFMAGSPKKVAREAKNNGQRGQAVIISPFSPLWGPVLTPRGCLSALRAAKRQLQVALPASRPAQRSRPTHLGSSQAANCSPIIGQLHVRARTRIVFSLAAARGPTEQAPSLLLDSPALLQRARPLPVPRALPLPAQPGGPSPAVASRRPLPVKPHPGPAGRKIQPTPGLTMRRGRKKAWRGVEKLPLFAFQLKLSKKSGRKGAGKYTGVTDSEEYTHTGKNTQK